jgi:hypothetical protein
MHENPLRSASADWDGFFCLMGDDDNYVRCPQNYPPQYYRGRGNSWVKAGKRAYQKLSGACCHRLLKGWLMNKNFTLAFPFGTIQLKEWSDLRGKEFSARPLFKVIGYLLIVFLISLTYIVLV